MEKQRYLPWQTRPEEYIHTSLQQEKTNYVQHFGREILTFLIGEHMDVDFDKAAMTLEKWAPKSLWGSRRYARRRVQVASEIGLPADVMTFACFANLKEKQIIRHVNKAMHSQFLRFYGPQENGN